MISIIVAVAQNNAIGRDNDLLWHLPDDLKYFKRITSGHPVIMGRRTWLSLPRRPLPNRRNIVISDIPDDRLEGAEIATSIDHAVSLCNPGEENFVIGGASVYRQFLPLCNRVYLTKVYKDFDGDVFFPELDPAVWKLVSAEEPLHDRENDFTYAYLVYEKVSE
jgi:dihydrofolate reductase